MDNVNNSDAYVKGVQKEGKEKEKGSISTQNGQNERINIVVSENALKTQSLTLDSPLTKHGISLAPPANQKAEVIDQTTSTFQKTVQKIEIADLKELCAKSTVVTDEGHVYQPEYLNKLSKEERAEVESKKIGYAPEGEPFVFKDDSSRDLFFKMRDEGNLKFFGDEGFSAAFMERTKDIRAEDSIVFNDEIEWQSFNKEVAVAVEENGTTRAASVVSDTTTDSVAEPTESPPLSKEEVSNIPPAHLEYVEKILVEKLMSPETTNGSRTAISLLLQATREVIAEKKREERQEINRERRIEDQKRQDLNVEYVKEEIKSESVLREAIVDIDKEEIAITEKIDFSRTLNYIKWRAQTIGGGIFKEEIFRTFNLELAKEFEDLLKSWEEKNQM